MSQKVGHFYVYDNFVKSGPNSIFSLLNLERICGKSSN